MTFEETKFIPMLKAYGTKRIIKSYDFKIALIITVILSFLILYFKLEVKLTPTIFTIYATIASGMIAIIIAALAIVATMADNDFIVFLNQKEKLYNNILFVFWYTSIITGLSIAINVISYVFIIISSDNININLVLITIATFFTNYIVLAVIQAIGAVMRFGLLRTEYYKSRIK
jgi:hypothetical protein